MSEIGLLAITHVLVVVVFSVGSLVLGISFMLRPLEKKLGLMKPASWASLLAIASATLTGLSVTFVNSADVFSTQESYTLLLLGGFAEALVPAIFGTAALSLAWMFVFIGLRRLD